MCIIAVKRSNASHPTMEQLEQMWKRNSDGAGIAYPDVNGGISVIKGLMTLDSFKEAMKDLLEIKDIFYLLHFRIATHGSRGADMTHPFWLRENKVALAHNGILPFSGLVDSRSGRSDTAAFTEDVLAKLPEAWYDQESFRHVIETYMGYSNKIAVIAPDGLRLLNQKAWVEDSETKMLYSNESFRVYKPYYPINSTGGTQAENFRSKNSGDAGTSGNSEYRRKRAIDVAELGKRAGSMVKAGLLEVEEARLIVATVKLGEWMPQEGEEFLDFYQKVSELSDEKNPTLIWALELLGLDLDSFGLVPDVLLAAGILDHLDELETAGVKNRSLIQSVIKEAVAEAEADLDHGHNTETPISSDPIRFWDVNNSLCFLNKVISIRLNEGARRTGRCTAIGALGISYARLDGGTGWVGFDSILDIEECLALNNPQMKDLQAHFGCLVAAKTVSHPNTFHEGRLISISHKEFGIKCDMGVNIFMSYDETLSVTILDGPMKLLTAENKEQ